MNLGPPTGGGGGDGGTGGGGDGSDGGTGGGGASDPAKPELQGAGVTKRYGISPGDSVEIRSQVENSGDEPASPVTVSWSVGGQQVGSDSAFIRAGENESLSTTVAWEDLAALGYQGREVALSARLDSGPSWDHQSVDSGTLTVTEQQNDSDNRNGNDSGSDNDNGNDNQNDDSSAFALLPGLGPLSSAQTTAVAVLGLVVVLGVVR